MDLAEYAGNLLGTISECNDIIKILNKEKISPNGGVFLLDHLILKICVLFDDDTRSISVHGLRNKTKNTSRGATIEAAYKKTIRKPYSVLVARCFANRNTRIAHHQEKEYLGWDPVTAAGLERLKKSGVLILSNTKPVNPKRQFITPKNAPLKSMSSLVDDLRRWIFFDILYPNAPRTKLS